MWFEIIAGLVGIGLFYLWRLISYQSFWTSKGIWQLRLSFSDAMGMILQKDNFNILIADTYDKAKKFGKEKVYGFVFGTFPMVVISDPELLKQIMVKDFDNFVDRDQDKFNDFLRNSNLKSDRIWANTLLNLKSDRWRQVRSTFSPIFTSGRMKAMSVLMKESVNQLITAFNSEVPASGEKAIELRDMLGKYSMDVIASCAFGVNSKSFSKNEADKEFVGHAARFFTKSDYESIVNFMFQIPLIGFWLVKTLKLPTIREDEINFFYDVVKQTLEERIRSKSRRNDIIDMMIDAIKGDLKEDKEQQDDQYDKDAELKTGGTLKGISAEEEQVIMVATAMVMLVAGYDTTAMTMTYACYELAKHPDVQERLREEVDEVYGQKDDEECITLDYQDVQSMEYLDQVLNETLRKDTPVGAIARASAEEYTIPGGRGTIPKQSLVMIPILSMHHSSEYYPEPEKFDPDRFSKVEKAKRHPYTFLPFGQGPRGCIGMRFAQLEAKLGLAALVRHYEIVPCSQTVDKVEIDPESFLMSPKGGLWVAFRKRF